VWLALELVSVHSTSRPILVVDKEHDEELVVCPTNPNKNDNCVCENATAGRVVLEYLTYTFGSFKVDKRCSFLLSILFGDNLQLLMLWCLCLGRSAECLLKGSQYHRDMVAPQ
jgi:hypothetical protein